MALFGVVGDEAVEGVIGEFGASGEEGQFDEEGDADDFAAELFDHSAGGLHGASGGEEVIDHEDALTVLDGVGVDFEFVGSVFEFVFFGDGLSGQFAGLAYGDETDIEFSGDGGAEDKAAGFGADDEVDVLVAVGIGHCLAGQGETLGVG